MAMAMWIITLVIVLMTMAMRIITLMLMMVLVLMMMMMFVFFDITFYLLNPRSRSSYLFEIKELCIQNLAERHIAVITINNLCLGLNRAKDSTNMLTFFNTYLRHLI